jgi:hypothetical protein
MEDIKKLKCQYDYYCFDSPETRRSFINYCYKANINHYIGTYCSLDVVYVWYKDFTKTINKNIRKKYPLVSFLTFNFKSSMLK